MKLDEFSDTKLSGTVNADETGLCYFSIPYEKGWTAYVDGEKTATQTVGGAMLAVPIEKGKHNIKLVYFPEGMTLGIAVSSISFIIWAVMLLIETDVINKFRLKIQNNSRRKA